LTSRDAIKNEILAAMQKNESLKLDYGSVLYLLYRDVYLKDLESVIFAPGLAKEEQDRRIAFVEKNQLNLL